MALASGLYESFPTYAVQPPPGSATECRPVVVVGGGPVGLTLAAGLAHHGQPVILLEARRSVSFGSRATCISRRSLEIWERHGVAERSLAVGLPWTGGRSFWRTHEVLRFAMPHDGDQKHPPMINLQQNFAEQHLVDALAEKPEVELRWGHRVAAVTPRADGVTVAVETEHGAYAIEAEWLVAADGASSFVRRALGLRLEGSSYEGRYLIADIRLRSSHPTERRAWFDPPSNRRSTVLMHRQPDDVWRVDYQLRDEDDPAVEVGEDRVRARIDAHLAGIGETPDYELIWTSLYKAHTLTLPDFRHGRVLLAGDAAHLVPIFGVRGLNSGIDDADNLAWKLAGTLRDPARETLLDSYSTERVYAARENIRQARKSTLFMTPPSRGFALMRDAALSLAVSHDFARPLVNPRQTTAIAFPSSPLQTEDVDDWHGGPPPGTVLPNAPVEIAGAGTRSGGHLLDLIGRLPLVLQAGGGSLPDFLAAAMVAGSVDLVLVDPDAPPAEARTVHDRHGRAAALLDLEPGTLYLVRPDGHVAARARQPDAAWFTQAVARLEGRP